MQSIVCSALKSSAPQGGSRRSGICGCGGPAPEEEHVNAPLQHKRGGSSGAALLPAHALTAPHIPPAKASKAFTYALSAKRLVLNRVRLGTQVRLTPNAGTPDSVDAAREEQDLSTALDATMFPHETKGPDGKVTLELDLTQFKSVCIPPAAAAASSSSKQPPRAFKLYLTVYPHHTYKLQFSSAREREVWRELLQSYGEYHLIPSALKKDEQKSNGSSSAHPHEPHHDRYPSQPISPRSLAVANAITQALGAYNAYTIAPLYVRTLLTFFDALQSNRAFEKEGLFRTGRSNPALLKQVLLNGGTLSGLDDQPAHTDGHTMAFNVKSLLRCLPESLFTAAKSDAIFDAAAMDDAALLVRLLNHLPPANILLLQRLFELMYLTLSSPSSRMTTDSLTKVVGPNLLAKDDVASIRAMTGSGVATFQDEAGNVHVSRGAAAATAAAAAASGGSIRPLFPAPGSIPMLKLFTLMFALGSKIWPGSIIFASEAGLNSVMHPPQDREYGHVRVHAGDAAEDDSAAASSATAAAPDQRQLALARGLSPVAEEHGFSPTPASSNHGALSPPLPQPPLRNGTVFVAAASSSSAACVLPATPTAVPFDAGRSSATASSSTSASSSSSSEMCSILPGSTLPTIVPATRLPVHRDAMHHRPEDLVYEQEDDIAVEDAEQIQFPTFHFDDEED